MEDMKKHLFILSRAIYRSGIMETGFHLTTPAHGLLVYSKEEFVKSWVNDGKDEG
jgi:hypothetical protein